jgi:hypothetical protein
MCRCDRKQKAMNRRVAATCLFLLAVMAVMLFGSCQKTTEKAPPVPEPEPAGTPATGFPFWDKPYLLVNGINTEEKSLSENNPQYEINVHYVQITGLLDTRVQEAINVAIREEAERFAAGSLQTSAAGKSCRWAYGHVTSNYNNVLCIWFNFSVSTPEHRESKSSVFLFDLNTGNRLTLKDLFIPGTDYLKLISSAVKAEIMRGGLEEEILYRPFDLIPENLPFVLNDNHLIILFPEKNIYFSGGQQWQFTVPLRTFGEKFIAYSRYVTDKPLYVTPSGRKHMLPGKVAVSYKQLEDYGDGWWIGASYPELAGLPALDLQAELNRNFAADSAAFIRDEAFKTGSAVKHRENRDWHAHRHRNVYVTANFADILCISESETTWWPLTDSVFEDRRSYLYSIRTGRPLALNDLFVADCDYIAVINRYISKETAGRQQVWGQSYDEAEGFYLTSDSIVVYIRETQGREDYRVYSHYHIPFEEFGQDVFVFHQ